MADEERELLDEVLSGSETMARIADDEETFPAAVDAFRAQDGESMHELLDARAAGSLGGRRPLAAQQGDGDPVSRARR